MFSISNTFQAVTKKNITLEEEYTELDRNLKKLQVTSKNRAGVEEQLLRMKTKLKDLEAEVSKKNLDIGDLILEKHRMDVELKEREERILQLEM